MVQTVILYKMLIPGTNDVKVLLFAK